MKRAESALEDDDLDGASTLKIANAACLSMARDARICRGERARPALWRRARLLLVMASPIGALGVVAVLLVKRARQRRLLELRARTASSL